MMPFPAATGTSSNRLAGKLGHLFNSLRLITGPRYRLYSSCRCTAAEYRSLARLMPSSSTASAAANAKEEQ